jgi:hypothetical protein
VGFGGGVAEGGGKEGTNLPAEFCTPARGTASTGAFLAIVVALLSD